MLDLIPPRLNCLVLCLAEGSVIFRRFLWASLAYMCTKVTPNHIRFFSFFNHVPSKLSYLYFHRPEVKAGENYHIFSFQTKYWQTIFVLRIHQLG